MVGMLKYAGSRQAGLQFLTCPACLRQNWRGGKPAYFTRRLRIFAKERRTTAIRMSIRFMGRFLRAAYLGRWPNPETIENGAMDGAFFETYVVSEIIKSYYNAGKRPDLYYYRDIDGKEIDLLLVQGDKIYPMEIKKAKMPGHGDKNFSVLKKFKMDVQPGIILCMADEMLPFNRDTWYFPAAAI